MFMSRNLALITRLCRDAGLVAAVALPFMGEAALADGALVRRWVAHDSGGRAISWMEVEQASNGTLQAKLLRAPAGFAANAVCSRCSGSLKDRPMAGFPIAVGLQRDGDKWRGQIIDARNGDAYTGFLRRAGDELEMRGYIGLEALGQSQMWRRMAGDPPRS